MIVKRVTEALRRQDWAMVAIEFVLVVAGVLLAFQINEWAAQRAGKESRQRAAVRLLEEVERDVAYIRQATEYEQRNVAALKAVINRIDAGRGLPADDASLMAKLASARSMVALAPPSSVYDDIVSSGGLNQIGDEAVRAAIGRYRSTLSFEERMRQQLQTILPDLERIDAFRYAVGPEGRLSIDVDYPALRQDRKARQVVALATENHRILLMLRTRALRDAERMCVAVGQSVGRACDLRRPPPSFDQS